MRQEPMGRGAPHTLERLKELVAAAADNLSDMELVFRSDRDGPVQNHG